MLNWFQKATQCAFFLRNFLHFAPKKVPSLCSFYLDRIQLATVSSNTSISFTFLLQAVCPSSVHSQCPFFWEIIEEWRVRGVHNKSSTAPLLSCFILVELVPPAEALLCPSNMEQVPPPAFSSHISSHPTKKTPCQPKCIGLCTGGWNQHSCESRQVVMVAVGAMTPTKHSGSHASQQPHLFLSFLPIIFLILLCLSPPFFFVVFIKWENRGGRGSTRGMRVGPTLPTSASIDSPADLPFPAYA